MHICSRLVQTSWALSTTSLVCCLSGIYSDSERFSLKF